jgi:predicted DNA-binding transcriptional regulator YafY
MFSSRRQKSRVQRQKARSQRQPARPHLRKANPEIQESHRQLLDALDPRCHASPQRQTPRWAAEWRDGRRIVLGPDGAGPSISARGQPLAHSGLPGIRADESSAPCSLPASPYSLLYRPSMSKTTPRVARKSNRTEASKSRKASRRTAESPKRRRSAEEQLVGFPLKRVFDVHTWINDGRIVTKASLADEWEVSLCTVKRALQFMCTRLEMPIEWDNVRKTYYYTRPFPTLPFLILTRREALVIALANRVCRGMFGPSFGRVFDGLLKKIAPALGRAVARALATMNHVHASQPASAMDEFELLLPILDAIEGRQVLRFDYTKLETTTAEQRTVHPLDISLVENALRLIAHVPDRGRVGDFVLARIRNLKPLAGIFERPKDFDAQKRVRDCAGSHAGDEEQEIRIALDTRAAAHARERAWHHSQQFTTLPDGRIEMTLRTGDLPGIKSRVLRWGAHAEVLAPVALRDEVRKELHAALAHY